MKKLALIAAAFALVACDNPQRTADTLETQIAAYRAAPGATQQQAVEDSFAKLDAQITELRKQGKADEARLLGQREVSLRAEYSAAKVAHTIEDTKAAIQGIGEAFKDAGKSIQDAFRTPTPPAEEIPPSGTR